MSRRTKKLAKVATTSSPADSTALALPTAIDDRIGQAYLDWLAGKVASTQSNYHRDLQRFAEFMGLPGVAAAFAKLLAMAPVDAVGICRMYRTQVVGMLRTTERPDGLAPATINRRLCALRSMLKTLRQAALTVIEPDLSGLRAEPYRDTRGVGMEAVEQVIAHLQGLAEEGDPQALRDLAIIHLLFYRALRRAEVLSLDVEHVDLVGRRLYVLQKKRIERHWVPIGQIEIDALRRWLDVRGDVAGPVFQSLHPGYVGKRLEIASMNRIVKKRGLEAGVSGVKCHGLRHSAITQALDQYPIHKVREFARHSKIDTTMIYDDNRGKDIIELDQEEEE